MASRRKDVFYLTLDGQLMSVHVDTTHGLDVGAPSQLFDARIDINPRGDHYAVSADGQRFLVKRSVDCGNRDPWTAVLNWQELLVR